MGQETEYRAAIHHIQVCPRADLPAAKARLKAAQSAMYALLLERSRRYQQLHVKRG